MSARSTSTCTTKLNLRSYLARLQHVAGNLPLLLAEAGADSIREGLDGQAELTAMQIRAAFAEGACGAIAFAWTDEWWRGGHDVDDWAFGLVDHDRRPKPAAAAVAEVFSEAPFSSAEQRTWPKVSVVVCAYNAADTLDDCLTSLDQLTYPDYEVIVVNDGSKDDTEAIARRYPFVRLITTPNNGLSAARNIGLSAATGAIVAYTDADVRVDPDWLTYLVQPFLHSDVVAAGGPNVVPADDPWVAQCVARAPGGPTHVLFDDRIAEHVPGLQPGRSPRSAARDWRLQPDLPARRRRRRRVLAAAGARRQDWLRAGRARVASPPRLDRRLLAAASRLRRRRGLAAAAPSRQVRRVAHPVARARLQPAAVRALAVRHPRQRRARGARRRFPRSIAPTWSRCCFAPQTLTWQIGALVLMYAGVLLWAIELRLAWPGDGLARRARARGDDGPLRAVCPRLRHP